MIRLFAALAIPPEIGAGLVRCQTGIEGARWRPLEALHVTLRFFGDIPEDQAEDLDVELSRIIGPALEIALTGVGAFGEGERIEAIWAGVAANPGLTVLAGRCERAARRAGLKADTRVYHPHVTLAYPRRPDPAQVAAWIQTHNLLASPSFRVAGFGLYSSWNSREGSCYQAERVYRLG